MTRYFFGTITAYSSLTLNIHKRIENYEGVFQRQTNRREETTIRHGYSRDSAVIVYR